MDCKQTQTLIIPLILSDVCHDSKSFPQLQAHLQSCKACAEEYEASSRTLVLIEHYKAEFTEFIDSPQGRDNEKTLLEHSWKNIEAKLDKLETEERIAKKFNWDLVWKIASIAACLVIGFCLLLMSSNHMTAYNTSSHQAAQISGGTVMIECFSDQGRITIPAGKEIRTAHDELKILTVNVKHQMVLNSNTILSIKPLLTNNHLGCIVKLISGEIFARVEHDGNPFVINTAVCNAVITGTIFDIQTTDKAAKLVVTEGTVQFTSASGSVQVAAGYISEIHDQLLPTEPELCEVAALTAWATGDVKESLLANNVSSTDMCHLDDIGLIVSPGSYELEKMDYENWLEENHNWFKQEFPWIFQLKHALAKEGVAVDYPTLLINSGDFWLFVYPEAFPQQLSIFDSDSLVKLARHYDRDEKWLSEYVNMAKYGSTNKTILNEKAFSLKAFAKWARCLEDIKDFLKDIDSEQLFYSLHASVYLVHTRSLAWFGVSSGQLNFVSKDKQEILKLLGAEVNAAHNCRQIAERLISAERKIRPCDEYEYRQLMARAIENIQAMMDIEKKLGEYEVR